MTAEDELNVAAAEAFASHDMFKTCDCAARPTCYQKFVNGEWMSCLQCPICLELFSVSTRGLIGPPVYDQIVARYGN